MIEAYKAEYDLLRSTGITHKLAVDKLHSQYDLDSDELKIANSWNARKKPKSRTATYEVLPTIVTQELTQSIVQEVLPDSKEKIDRFKELALDHCLSFMSKDARFAEVKEFKDIVAVVDSIEKSYDKSKGSDAPTINILVQNLVERFRDDC